MTIQEIIKKLNYLNCNSKNMPASVWLYEIEKYEDLFCNHPDANKTRFVDTDGPMKLEMMSAYQQETN